LSAAFSDLPPYKALAAALRKTTEHLARELVRPSHSPPDWTELEFGVAQSVTAMQGITVLLANRLRWRGPPAWEAFLAGQREQSVLREALLARLLERIDSATREARIPCVALKGSALRSLGLYAPGERPSSDIDLLVRKCDSAAVAKIIGGLDYVLIEDVERHASYVPRKRTTPTTLGEHASNIISIEVHTLVAEALPIRKVDITERLQPVHPEPGVNPYPSLAALLLHLLLHAADNMKTHCLRQVQLHDVALLLGRFGASDWDALLEAARAGDLWWAYPPLAMTVRYYDCRVPEALLHSLRRSCPAILRRVSDRDELTDVSWSNLRISALPGIAWSHTPIEALRYAWRRVSPERDTLDEVRTALELQPQLGIVPWYQVSQSKRIVRWLVSRPPRVQTLSSVAAALRGSDT
jgi:putative nucleotidyltransferase-like protein